MGRRSVAIWSVVVLLLAVAAAIWRFGSPPVERVASMTPSVNVKKVEGDRRVEAAKELARSAPVPPASARDAARGENAAEPTESGMATSLNPANLDEVRKVLPDNLYWTMSAPTTDEKLQEWRDEERDRWNVEYGKVLSGTGTEAEIRAYYDQRAKLSADYVEFATYLLDHYSEQLREQDIGLLTLAKRLHLARLEEIPRKVEEALERKRQQDEAREAWLADQAEFGADSNPQ